MYKSNVLIGLALLFSLLFLQNVAKCQIIKPGAFQTSRYIPLIINENIAVVTNHTGNIENVNIVDSLLSLGVNIRCIFSPEHGFRGEKNAGQLIDNNIDSITKLPIISLYGKNKKPQAGDLANIDVVLFDLQDVGVRFYTYISTLHYVMEACAENGVKLIVLDRPNPNGFYIDGPVLNPKFSSFVGIEPIPLVYGMTIGELALMINGEMWISKRCQLKVIKCLNYSHKYRYKVPISPSPNLPDMKSVYLYPSLGLFEGTQVSAGRGTNNPFQKYGHPKYSIHTYSFTPRKNWGASYPKFEGQVCYGRDLSNDSCSTGLVKHINLNYLIDAYKYTKTKKFFNSFFYRLAGNKILQKQIENNISEDSIRSTWQHDISIFKTKRKKYLLYSDF